MKLHYLKAILSVTFTIFGFCANAQITRAPEWEQKIMGSWQSFKIVCCGPQIGAKPRYIAPEEQMTVTFKANNQVTYSRSGEIAKTDSFIINAIGNPKHPERYELWHPVMYGIIHFVKDTLVIGICATDGCDTYYKPVIAKNRKRRKGK